MPWDVVAYDEEMHLRLKIQLLSHGFVQSCTGWGVRIAGVQRVTVNNMVANTATSSYISVEISATTAVLLLSSC